jgi:hypothetical protein
MGNCVKAFARQVEAHATSVRRYSSVKLGDLVTGPGATREALRALSRVTFSRLGHHGQFGNQLFQISAVLGFAAKYGCRPTLPPWRCAEGGFDYGNYFPELNRYFGRCSGTVYREPNFAYNEIPFILNVDLRGHFQSEKYFMSIKSKIREIFREPPFVEAALNSYCADHRLNEFNAIHFRFYSDPIKDKRTVLDALPDSYFLKAMERLGSNRPLVVATDDKSKLREFLVRNGIADGVHVLTLDHPLLDFFMLARAERIAIGNSSFSWWAAYLGKQKSEILAPDRHYWFNPAERLKSFWNTKDLYPESFKELIF